MSDVEHDSNSSGGSDDDEQEMEDKKSGANWEEYLVWRNAFLKNKDDDGGLFFYKQTPEMK